MTSAWNPGHYLKYGDERTRPSVDLAAAVKLHAPKVIVDLGCGPGNSTRVLRARWPEARLVGIDSSEEMIEAAKASELKAKWVVAEMSHWQPDGTVDVLFSNAALQWVPDHASLLTRLLNHVAVGGALAFQIPSSTYATVRTLIHEISTDSRWSDRLEQARRVLTMESPEYYYDMLCEATTCLDIWETEYGHVMQDQDAIVDWISSTGLRPFLNPLEDSEKTDFIAELRRKVQQAYSTRADGKVLFPFRRTFVVAYR